MAALTSTTSTPCAACKFLRRKCTAECMFAPYFPPDEPASFTCVHKVFGASNVSKMLAELPTHLRQEAVQSLVYEADARLRDPIYGCVGYISVLQHRLRQLHTEIEIGRQDLAFFLGPAALFPISHPSNPLHHAIEAITSAAKAAQFAMVPTFQVPQPMLTDTFAAALSFTNNGQVEQYDGGGFEGGGTVLDARSPAASPPLLVKAEAASQYQQLHHNFSQQQHFTQPLLRMVDNGGNNGGVTIGPSA